MNNIVYRATQGLWHAGDFIHADAIVYAVGYESRSLFALEHASVQEGHVLAVRYTSNHIFAFDQNLAVAEDRRHLIVADRPDELGPALERFVQQEFSKAEPVSIAVDVSAMNRSLMAEILLRIQREIRPRDRLVLLYSPAEFQEPSLELVPLKAVTAAHPALAGTITDPSRGRCMILGLGYEYGISLSVLDTHEPEMSFIFRPVGFDSRFSESMKKANFEYDFGERSYEIIEYSLGDIPGLFNDMSSIMTSSKHNYSITCVPFGPKIFSAVSIIAAAINYPDVTVLRYAMSETIEPRDAKSSGLVIGCILEAIAYSRPKVYSETWAYMG
ncbi:hypothetical protein CK228_12850 [Mesorhizobium sp. WSM4312]|uniref:hypothetical protein n=1 Tax=Mesorhizobium sp. WSM4312 TaxID=2029411 RepID=UPI000BAF36D3|nr:hypothetical protein [Mesorhizobium sp. WSM4312]PBB68017.1 hypothetical protein CK228_12850 [Mesorhizobium sp. WSM4312]